MKRFSIVLAVAAAVAYLVLSGLLYLDAKNSEKRYRNGLLSVKTTAEYAVSLAEINDRVIDLPEDGGKWYTTVLTNKQPTPRKAQVLAWFDRDPSLIKLKAQTHWHHYTPASAVYGNLARAATNGTPCVMVQDASGKVVYKSSGADVPATSLELVRGVIQRIRDCCPVCPRPKPRPDPLPDVPDIVPDVVPDVVGPDDTTDPNGRDDTLLVALIAFVAALGIGFLVTAKGQSGNFKVQ